MTDNSDIFSVIMGDDLDFVDALEKKGVSLRKPDDFESKLVSFMKVWGSSPRYGVSVDAATEAMMVNVARFLGEALFGDQPCPDPTARLTPGEMVFLRLYVKLANVFAGIALDIGQLAPSTGYEPLLRQGGFDPISARGLAHLIAGSGERQAKEQQLRLQTVRTIRALLEPRTDEALLNSAALLLAIAEESSVVDTICCEVGLRETDLLPLLRNLIHGKAVDKEWLAEILEKLTPALSVPRGPKKTAASAAHEFALNGGLPAKLGCSAYTLNDVVGDFTDPLTLATRLEFEEPGFDPRPAYRRIKKRRLAETD
jgi:hypothetical protein